jgi:hypothetical protein
MGMVETFVVLSLSYALLVAVHKLAPEKDA